MNGRNLPRYPLAIFVGMCCAAFMFIFITDELLLAKSFKPVISSERAAVVFKAAVPNEKFEVLDFHRTPSVIFTGSEPWAWHSLPITFEVECRQQVVAEIATRDVTDAILRGARATSCSPGQRLTFTGTMSFRLGITGWRFARAEPNGDLSSRVILSQHKGK